MRQTSQPRRSGCSISVEGAAPDFSAADAPGAGRIKMAQGHLSSSLLRAPRLRGLVVKGSGTTYPEPGVIQLPATAHLLGSNGECVTTICDMGGRMNDQNGPR